MANVRNGWKSDIRFATRRAQLGRAKWGHSVRTGSKATLASKRVPPLLAGFLVAACSQEASQPPPSDTRLAAAEAFIDAFYSFDPRRLRNAMASAPSSIPPIVYYQGWAQGGNYVVLERKPCRFESADEATCDVTVRDDLIPALGSEFRVTDSLHLTFKGDRIAAVKTTSNDPPEAEAAFNWIERERPELFKTGACRGFFAGGPTPQDCIKAVVVGFKEFSARHRR